jgi:hypothetical protein
LQDLQSAIAFTAQVTREYFGRHSPGDLDNCINHAIVARHILMITFAIEAVLIGGHAGWQYGPGAYDSVTCEDYRGRIYHYTAGGNFSGHAWIKVAGLIFDPRLYQLPAKIVLADRADKHRSRITHNFGSYLLVRRGSTMRANFLRTHKIPKAGAFYYERGATRRPRPLRGEWRAEIRIVGGISWVEAPGFALDAKRGEFLPEAAEVDTTHVEHGAGAGHDPAHSGAFHAVFDDTPAGPFDDTGGDREAVLEVDIVGHALGIVVEVAADALQRLAAFALELVVRTEPAQGVDHGGDLTVEEAARLPFDEVAGGITPIGMEQVRGLPQVAEGVQQIEDRGHLRQRRGQVAPTGFPERVLAVHEVGIEIRRAQS